MSCDPKNRLILCEPYKVKIRRVVCARRYCIAQARKAGLTSWGDATGNSLSKDQVRECMECPHGARRAEDLRMEPEIKTPPILQEARARRGEGHPRSKVTEAVVRDIRRRRTAGEKVTAIARSLGMKHNTVSGISRGKTWRHIKD